MAAKKSTDVVDWKAQMAAEAETAKSAVSEIGSSNFFSLKNGKLSYNDQQMPNNEMAVIIMDFVNENTYYDVPFDSDNPASPVCFSFGRVEADMIPHTNVVDPQNETCKGCEWSIFGSADVGKGKACRNAMRTLLTPCGAIDDQGEFTPNLDPEYYETSDVAILKVPPTSLRAFAKYVRDITGATGMSPMAMFTHIKVVDDDSDQFHVQFTALGKVPESLFPALMPRLNALRASEELEQPYQPMEEEEEPAPRKRAPKKKASAKGRGNRKY